MKLTASTIAKGQPGQTLTDSVIPGLQVRCGVKSKAYYLYYRTKDGRQRRPKLGSTKILSLGAARDIARGMLAHVAAGGDPVADRKLTRGAPVVRDLADRYLLEHAAGKKSKANDENLIKLYVKPRLGKLRVKDVAYDDVSALHRSMVETPHQANRLLSLLSKMFTLAEQWQLRPAFSNPCRHVRRYPERKRRRYVRADGEAARIAGALALHESTAPEATTFLWTLIFSGARPGEVLAFTWSELHDNRVVLAEHKTDHTGEPRTIHLPKFVAEKINALPRVEDDPRIFRRAGPPKKIWEKIRATAGCPDLRMYDLRHTFASAALAVGYNLDHIGELLGHKSTQTTSRYAHLADDPQHEAVEATAQWLQRMLTVSEDGVH